MKVLVALLVTFILSGSSLVSAAEPQITGNQIAQSCHEYLKEQKALSVCSALFRGVFEGHLQGAVIYGAFHNIAQFSDFPFMWCPSDRSAVSDVQLVSIYTKYVEEQPEATDRGAANIAVTAFMLSWPCEK